MAISLSPASDHDNPFLFQVYASTRAEEMALVDWTLEQKAAFLQMQFNAQRHHYSVYYPAATYHIIRRDDVPIGRMIIHRSANEILLMDIALLPTSRNSGIGTRLIRQLQDEAASTGQAVHLHVESFNPARRLYQRLGFYPISESGIYIEMEWQARSEQDRGALPDHSSR